jgi:hypothetical protein
MTIAQVRFYYYPKHEKKKLLVSQTYWGFADWFVRRLKPIREQLRGPEVKGVNIVNFMLHEDYHAPSRLLEWWQCANSFEYALPFDFQEFEKNQPIFNIEQLMLLAAEICETAPWPQVRAVGIALALPLSAEERVSILPFLKWPRELS